MRELSEGDLIWWDADEWHEVTALEPHEWLGMQFYSDTINLGKRNKLSQEEAVDQTHSEASASGKQGSLTSNSSKGDQ